MKKTANEFLKSKQWTTKQKNIMRRDGYIDQYVKRTEGRTVQADLVHHILPKEEFPQYALADWNLIAVSRKTHMKVLHNPINGALTKEGQRLMIETAWINGVKLSETVLVLGMPGVGKRAYVRQRLGQDGICYDLDTLAAAMRLRLPGEENHDGSRRMTNALFRAFAIRGKDYAPRVYLIRTSSTPEELAEILPDRVVWIKGDADPKRVREMKTFDPAYVEKRISDSIEYCRRNNIEVEEVPPQGR